MTNIILPVHPIFLLFLFCCSNFFIFCFVLTFCLLVDCHVMLQRSHFSSLYLFVPKFSLRKISVHLKKVFKEIFCCKKRRDVRKISSHSVSHLSLLYFRHLSWNWLKKCFNFNLSCFYFELVINYQWVVVYCQNYRTYQYVKFDRLFLNKFKSFSMISI